MGVSIDCREGRELAGRRAFRVGRRCGGVYSICLFALVGSCWLALAASGEEPASTFTPAPVPNVLVMEKESPEIYKKVVDESPYPPADSPEKLTSEQLDAIAKLAPKSNKAGVQTHPAMVPLFRSMVLKYTGGTYKNTPIRFRLHTPEPYVEGKKYPMVVWLHGAGECGDDNVDQLSHLHHMIPSLVGPKKRDFFLLVPQCPHSHVPWEAPEVCSSTVRPDGTVECHIVDDPIALGNAPVAFTLAMIDAVMKEFPVDANRITVAGLSTGGEGTWRILERRPDLFAAAVPVVSWKAMHEKSLREKPLLKKIPIWAVYSSDDNGIDFARKEFERMRDSGCRVFRTEFGVCGHRAWTPAMLQGDIFGWLISRAKDGDRYFAAEPSPTDPEKVGIFADVTEGDLKREPTKAVRPGSVTITGTGSLTASNGPVTSISGSAGLVTRGGGGGGASIITYAQPSEAQEAEEALAVIARRIEKKNEAPAIEELVQAPSQPTPGLSASQESARAVEQSRLELIGRYIALGDIKEALAVADKVKNRQAVVAYLLRFNPDCGEWSNEGEADNKHKRWREIFDYVDRELDRIEQPDQPRRRHRTSNTPPLRPRSVEAPAPRAVIVEAPEPVKEEPLVPIPAGKKTPKDDCGKEWAMSTTNQYGLFPNGWDEEAKHVPGYIVNETGKQLRDRLGKAFTENNLVAMKEFCESFIRLDDIPLSSPWFDTSGGRLQGRIKYALNDKAKPVVELLRDIAEVKAESKKEFVELARKSLERIDAITHPKSEE